MTQTEITQAQRNQCYNAGIFAAIEQRPKAVILDDTVMGIIEQLAENLAPNPENTIKAMDSFINGYEYYIKLGE